MKKNIRVKTDMFQTRKNASNNKNFKYLSWEAPFKEKHNLTNLLKHARRIPKVRKQRSKRIDTLGRGQRMSFL